MRFNPSKCFVMKITRKREPVIYDYKLVGRTLQSVSQDPYLVVEVSCTLDWTHHINSKVNKANQILRFLGRNLGTALNQLKN